MNFVRMLQDLLRILKHILIKGTSDIISMIQTISIESEQVLLQVSLTIKFLTSPVEWRISVPKAKKVLGLLACIRK